jgi:hypothetical protein
MDSLNEKQNEYNGNLENELKKIKLSLEHGMDLSKSFTSSSLAPESEGQFLDYIQQWEDQYAPRKMTTVFEMAGRPTFRLVNEVPNEEIDTALNEIMNLLNQYSIRVETLCEVDERELYRFITEELLNMQTEDIQIDGMMHCFTYEEFHPNHPYDIKNRCTEVIEHIASAEKDKNIIPWGFAKNVSSGGLLHTKEELNEQIIRFSELFKSLVLNECNYISVTLNETENEATAIAFVHYSGITGNDQTVELTGNCIFKLQRGYEWWTIHQFDMPWKMTN